MLQLIGSLVGVKEFGISTELNSLGLIDISAIRFATQLYKKFGLNLPPKNCSAVQSKALRTNFYKTGDAKNSAEEIKIYNQSPDLDLINNYCRQKIEHENADYNFIPQIMFKYQRTVVENISLPKFIGFENFERETSNTRIE